MPGRGPALAGRVGALLVAFALLAGCAGTYQPMGPPTRPPSLATSAVTTPDGVRLPVRSWLPEEAPPRAVILALHGFNDYANAFAAPGAWLAARGVAVYAYDQRGFGASVRPGIWPGTETLVADLHVMAELVHRRHPDTPLYLLGESMGGAVLITALTRPPPAGLAPLDPDGAILVAPATWGGGTLNPLYRLVLWLAAHTVPGLELRPPQGLDIQPSDNVEMLRALSRDPLVIKATRVDALRGLVGLMDEAAAGVRDLDVPALVMYGRHEQVLPRPAVERTLTELRARPPDRRPVIAIYPDGYHMLLRDRQAQVVYRDILAWIENPGAPLPSGADRAGMDMAAAAN